MAQQIKLEFISDGFKAILESEGTRQLVADVAAKIQSAANAGVKTAKVSQWKHGAGTMAEAVGSDPSRHWMMLQRGHSPRIKF